MHKLSYLILTILLVRLNLLSAAEADHTSDAELNKLITFAGYIEASIENEDPSFFNKSFDNDAFTKKIMDKNQSHLSEEFKKGFVDELRSGWDIGNGIVEEITKGGSYKFLNASYKEGKGEILFRFLTTQAINYHKLEVEIIENDLRITDVYVFQAGEKISESIGRLYNAFCTYLENPEKPAKTDWNSYREYEKLNVLLLKGKYKAVHRKITNLPDEMRKESLFLTMDMQITSRLDRKTFAETYCYYTDYFPETPGKYLIPLDGLMTHNEYRHALSCLDSLYKYIKTDPLLELLRANTLYLLHDYEEAIKKLSYLIQTDPKFESGYFSLLTIYIEREKYLEATHLLDNMIMTFDYYKEDLQPILAEYPAFLKSAEYKSWMGLKGSY